MRIHFALTTLLLLSVAAFGSGEVVHRSRRALQEADSPTPLITAAINFLVRLADRVVYGSEEENLEEEDHNTGNNKKNDDMVALVSAPSDLPSDIPSHSPSDSPSAVPSKPPSIMPTPPTATWRCPEVQGCSSAEGIIIADSTRDGYWLSKFLEDSSGNLVCVKECILSAAVVTRKATGWVCGALCRPTP